MKHSIAAALVAIASCGSLRAQPAQPALLKDVGIDQKMGAQIPLDLPFVDEQGREVKLREFSGKPTILALVYYQCPSLCNMVLSGILHSVQTLEFTAGQEFQVIAVSFDPRENYMMARDKKHNYGAEYGRAGFESGWHFLTAAGPSSRVLADAVGFHYRYDPHSNQFIHPSSILILTPDGRVSRYFYGINYPTRDVKLGLMDASGGKIGSHFDQVQLLCFHYDPTAGRYGFAIFAALRAAGIATLGGLAAIVIVLLRRERRERGA